MPKISTLANMIAALPQHYNTLEPASLFSFNNSYFTGGSFQPVPGD
jgi:hypothetical protein